MVIKYKWIATWLVVNLIDLCHFVNDDIPTRCNLWSSSQVQLLVPRYREQSGRRGFSVSSTQLWNLLPVNIWLLHNEKQLFIIKTRHHMQLSVLRHWGSMSPVWILLYSIILLYQSSGDRDEYFDISKFRYNRSPLVLTLCPVGLQIELRYKRNFDISEFDIAGLCCTTNSVGIMIWYIGHLEIVLCSKQMCYNEVAVYMNLPIIYFECWFAVLMIWMQTTLLDIWSHSFGICVNRIVIICQIAVEMTNNYWFCNYWFCTTLEAKLVPFVNRNG